MYKYMNSLDLYGIYTMAVHLKLKDWKMSTTLIFVLQCLYKQVWVKFKDFLRLSYIFQGLKEIPDLSVILLLQKC